MADWLVFVVYLIGAGFFDQPAMHDQPAANRKSVDRHSPADTDATPAAARSTMAQDIIDSPTRDFVARDAVLSSRAPDPVREPHTPHCFNGQRTTVAKRAYGRIGDYG
jgi:hypothetical protein